MNVREESAEVLYSADPIVAVTGQDVEELKARAAKTVRERIRLCAHRDVNDPVHEMLIVHRRGTYVRPHKHLRKTESFHVVEGFGTIVVFDDFGHITRRIKLGDRRSGDTFYYRLAEPVFHTLLIESSEIVFHEVAQGPFRRDDTVFAPWAPDGTVEALAHEFVEHLRDEGRDS